jgi:putative membrane protein insertion efficiency factor
MPVPILNTVLARVADLPRQALLLLVRGYRLLLKPSLGNACRFEPTCSQYALTALERHGALVGGTLAAGRLLRCHPWCDGGCDAVPVEPPRLFTRLGLGSGASPHNRAAASSGHAQAPQDFQESSS